ncbi:MAG: hypothetical protein AAF998_05350 [Bacteroidota bacterium]
MSAASNIRKLLQSDLENSPNWELGLELIVGLKLEEQLLTDLFMFYDQNIAMQREEVNIVRRAWHLIPSRHHPELQHLLSSGLDRDYFPQPWQRYYEIALHPLLDPEVVKHWCKSGHRYARYFFLLVARDEEFATLYPDPHRFRFIATPCNRVFPGLRNKRQLHELWLHDNLLTHLPEWMGEFSQLKIAHFSRNRLLRLPSTFGNLRRLETLHLSENRFPEIPPPLRELPNLQELHYAHNAVPDTTEFARFPPSLTRLVLLGNQLNDVTDIGHLIHLRELNLRDNQLERVPWAVVGLPALEALDLAKNPLKEIPAVFREMRLRQLDLSETEVESLPGILPATLEHLRLGGTETSTWENEFVRLPALQHLGLSGCELEQLPASLRHCSQLAELDVSENPALHLPAWLPELSALRTIDLTGCEEVQEWEVIRPLWERGVEFIGGNQYWER